MGRTLMLWPCREESSQLLDNTAKDRVGERKRWEKPCSPILPSFPLETNYCKPHTFEFIIFLLSPANLTLHERLGESRLEKSRWVRTKVHYLHGNTGDTTYYEFWKCVWRCFVLCKIYSDDSSEMIQSVNSR